MFITRSLKQVVLSCILLALVHTIAHAQNEANTPLGLKAGTPAGTYSLTDIDTVNLFNGQVNVRIPLVGQIGRGQAKSQMSYSWDSPTRYQVYKTYDPNNFAPIWTVGGGTANPDGSTSSGFHTGEYSVYPLGVFSGDGAPTYCSEGLYVWSAKTLTRFFWVEPDGTEHEMRDVLKKGEPLPAGGCWTAGPSRGKVFVSTDGSGATFISDNVVRDGIYVGMEYPMNVGWQQFGGWLLLRDGRRIRISSDTNRGLRDRNGNLMSSNATYPLQLADSLNRTITEGTGTASECSAIAPGSTGCSYWSYKGFGGTERRIYTFSTGFDMHFVLPNGTSYVFYFNEYWDLIRVDLPTGGSIEYEYGPGLSGTQPNMSWIDGAMAGTYPGSGGDSDAHVYRRVTERRVYKEAHVLESRQTFSKPEDVNLNNVGYVDKVNYDGNGNLLSTERHYFYGSAERSFWLQAAQYSAWKDGREYRSEIYDATGNLLRTVVTSWEQRAPVSWWTGNPDDAPQNDPRISQVTTLLENGAQYTNSYAYDPDVPYNSLIDVIERDFNLNIIRRKQTTYLKTLNGVDYAGLNVQTASALHMRDLPVLESIIGFSGEEARTTFEYDNYTSSANDPNHAALLPRANISGLDPAYTTSYVTRGNVTATTRHFLTNGTSTGTVTSYAQYDVAGNVVKTIDARGNATTFYFDDRFGSPNGDARANSSPPELSTPGKTSYAFPTYVVNAMGHTTYAQIDYYTGQAVDTEDPNGIVSSASFDDPLDRPKQVIGASNNSSLKVQSTFTYNDVAREVTTTSDLITYGDNQKKIKAIFDGLGRPVESRVYESSSTYIVTKTIFSGFTTQNSNPYRPGQENPAWTTTVVDALGRVKTVTTPDSAVVSTSYVGNEVTVTDQMGKKRKSVYNSVGHLVDVYEDPNGLNFRTSYGYDSAGNLLSVGQDYLSQPPRSFNYDSLGRMTSAFNPESGTTSFKYDAAGNMEVKSDARGVSTHYSYDALNRVTRRWYNGSALTTQTTHNNPALPTEVGTSDETKYIYDAQPLPSPAPTFTRGPSIGALVASLYGTNSSTGDYIGRDEVGRPAVKIQRTGGVDYKITVNYNPVGLISSMVYPSLNSVSYSYDGAGRLSSLAGTLGDGAGKIYSSSILYSPFGGIAKEQFGTATPIYNKLFYNSRAQLAEIYESTSYTDPTDKTWNRGKLINHYSDQCAGACTPTSAMTDNNGNLKKQEVFIPNTDSLPTTSYAMRWQQYSYDTLNRLEWAREVLDGSTEQWKQQFTYDRWGNRTINTAVSYGTGITNTAFTVNPYFNRLGVPSGQPGVMEYDAVGNLKTDSYTGKGNRTYNAENKISSALDNNSQTATYTYDASGERIKRTVSGVETWQVYGFTGELLAEYPANGATGSPQKEYGYRNGQLLIIGSPSSGGSSSGPNSISLNGTSAYAEVPNSSSLNIVGPLTMEAWIKLPSVPTSYQPILDHSPSLGNEGGYDMYVTDTGKARMDIFYYPSYQYLIGATTLTPNAWHHIAGVYDGSQLRLYVDGQLDGSVNLSSPMTGTAVQLRIGRNNYLYTPIYFNGLIDEARISTGALYSSNFTPAASLTASSNTKGLWKFDGQTVSDSSTNGNNGTLNGSATYSTDAPTGPSTSYYSGSFNGSSAYVEAPNSSSLNIVGSLTMEAWIKLPSVPTSYQPILDHSPSLGNEGGYDMYVTDTGKARMDIFYYPSYQYLIGATTLTANVWHHIAGVYDGSQLRLYVDGHLDGSVNLSSPMTGTAVQLRIGRNNYLYTPIYFNGLIDEVRISTGALYSSTFTPQTHLTASGSTKGLWKFDSQSTADSSGNGNNGTLQSGATYSTDVPSGDGGGGGSSGGGSSSSSGPQIQWLVTDQLGTPRMVFDQTGTLANTRRHDYLPFGDELFAGVAGRSIGQGYSPDGTRQRFTGYEADTETGLNFAQARYQSSVQGRFTSADPVSGTPGDPQTWNMYAYVGNNPLNQTDSDGMNYFSGRGMYDPHEGEYQVDGFSLPPEGSISQMPDSLAGYSSLHLQLVEAEATANSPGLPSEGEEPQRERNQPPPPKFEPWVIRGVGALEKKATPGTWDGYRDNDGIRQCAHLPEMWDFNAQGQPIYPRRTPQWQMGRQPSWGDKTTRGTVMATFDRAAKQYRNASSGNHTLVFLSWYETKKTVPAGRGKTKTVVERGMWVIEQGPNFAPRGRQILFSGSNNYFTDASFYNVVNICYACKAPAPPPARRR